MLASWKIVSPVKNDVKNDQRKHFSWETIFCGITASDWDLLLQKVIDNDYNNYFVRKVTYLLLQINLLKVIYYNCNLQKYIIFYISYYF